MAPTNAELWSFLVGGYFLTVLIETPILFFGLSRRHSTFTKLLAGFWLTACTYPIVILVLPNLLWRPFGYWPYIAVAETFAPLAECLLFHFFASRIASDQRTTFQDSLAITGANLTSFLLGLALAALGQS